MTNLNNASKYKPESRLKSRPRRRRRFRKRRRKPHENGVEAPAEGEQPADLAKSKQSADPEEFELSSKPEVSEDSKIQGDSLSFLAQIDDDSGGEDCALHIYEYRYDTRGVRVKLRVGTKTEFMPDKERSHKAGFVSTKTYSLDRSLTSTQLEIRSPFAKKAIRDVIRTYPGVNISGSKRIVLRDQSKCLFHYRKELRDYAETSSNLQMQYHVLFCLRYMETTLSSEIETYGTLVTNTASEPGLDFKNLWMAYIPGTDLFRKADGGVDSVVRLKAMILIEPSKHGELQGRKFWQLHTEEVNYDGKQFGFNESAISIRYYKGTKAFNQLDVYPLRYHEDQMRIRSSRVARGRTFVSMFGRQYRQYDGNAMLYDSTNIHHMMTPPRSMMDGMPFGPPVEGFYPIFDPSWIMVDSESYRQKNSLPSIRLTSTIQAFAGQPGAMISMSDDDLLICSPFCLGFSFGFKRWALFDVSKIQDVDFNKNAFRDLVLPQGRKDFIHSLVKPQKFRSLEFDDLIKGKGRGLIVLLHGPPDVGKTFTAESIADHTRRPLMRVSSDELTNYTGRAETELFNLLSLAKRWEALVLLDEADVFMQQRGLQSMIRNSLVSILLRVLEYFEGIMFLTTNRVETIDDAFKSRIHLSLSYPKLDIAARLQLWTSGLTRACRGQKPTWATEEALRKLADADINGRNIKNTIRLGCGLARDAGRGLKRSDIRKGLRALQSFEADFARLSEKE